MRYYFNAFKNYANFRGRATRKEYWYFILFQYSLLFVLYLLDGIREYYSLDFRYGYLTTGLIMGYVIAAALPTISLQVRRLHDVGKSGIWVFARGIPLLSLYLLYLNVQPGDIGNNEYGAPSKYDANYKSEIADNEFSTTYNGNMCERCNRPSENFMEIAIDDVQYRKVCPACFSELYSFAANSVSKPKNRAPKIVFCRKCGEKLIEGSAFCRKCGTEIIRGNENDKV